MEAAKWYRKAAEQNHAGAQYNLGSCYFNGRGVAKSYVEAYRWAVLASGQGIEEAKAIMKTLAENMTREQIAEAQRLARNFTPRKSLRSDLFSPLHLTGKTS